MNETDQSPSQSLPLWLTELHITGIGPGSEFKLHFGPHLNLLTGDNGLGKSFLLEWVWYVLSHNWTQSVIYPGDKSGKIPTVSARHSLCSEECFYKAFFDYERLSWEIESTPESTSLYKKQLDIVPMLFMGAEGNFVVKNIRQSNISLPEHLTFTLEEVWDGLFLEALNGNKIHACNGLIQDWVMWQRDPDQTTFQLLKDVLTLLSPPDLEHGDLGPILPTEPMRIPGDSRLFPAIKHVYGEIPLNQASSAIKRIVSFSYLLVWTLREHSIRSKLAGRKPSSSMIVLIDELEAHLHPQWQRVILPALISISKTLSPALNIQFFITSHSPLVLTSVEKDWVEGNDKLFHFNLDKSTFPPQVVVEEPVFFRHRTANSWLTSEIFELGEARSLEAEKLIRKALHLQKQSQPSKEELTSVSRALMGVLGAHDPFWPRWNWYVEQQGIER